MTLPAPAASEAHVWRVALRALDGRASRLLEVLDDAERARARAFAVAADRRRFAVSRAVLRHLLGRYLARDPSALRFRAGARGKPRLQGEGRPAWHFNVAHSGDVALLAFAPDVEIGVDVEQMTDDFDVASVARFAFSTGEQAALSKLPTAMRRKAFFAGWTRKEAVVKALGCGLSMSLPSFTVALDDLERELPGERDGTRWTLEDVSPGPSYCGAVAVPAPLAVRVFDFTF